MWSAFLTRHDILSKISELPQSLNRPELKKAIQVLSVMNFTEEEREAYEDHLKWLRIESNSLKKAEEKGEAKGRKEEKQQIALALLKQKLAVKQIAEATGLSIEEINRLKK
jgi:predicted transposase/invertase (TIGR01784 family)